MTIRRIAGILLVMILATSCSNKEPAFTVSGDAAVIKDIKVNVISLTDKDITMSTAYYNGKSYEIENQDAIRYVIYVSYKDLFFYKTEMDNLHGEIKGEPINEILISKKDGLVTALYRPLETSDSVGGTILQPSHVFFSNIAEQASEKRKFTALYQHKSHDKN
jgi:hypothetical protein